MGGEARRFCWPPAQPQVQLETPSYGNKVGSDRGTPSVLLLSPHTYTQTFKAAYT